MNKPLLEIKNATKIYSGSGSLFGKRKQIVALQNFNITIPDEPATITTIAGESGSGKTTLASLILGFISLTSGNIYYQGTDLQSMTKQQHRNYRREVQAVFQDPYEVYNPFFRVKHIFEVAIKNFRLANNKNDMRELIEKALNVVGLRGNEVLEKYPHQLSGGQRQRMMIARAFLLKPKLIVADEPVSMVDVSLRSMILDIMLRMRDEFKISFLYITHDLSTAYQIGDKIHILYQGLAVERGETASVIENPKHPYIQLLIDSVPVPDPDQNWGDKIILSDEEVMRGEVNSACRFYARCNQIQDCCLEKNPLDMYKVDDKDHEVACHLYRS